VVAVADQNNVLTIFLGHFVLSATVLGRDLLDFVKERHLLRNDHDEDHHQNDHEYLADGRVGEDVSIPSCGQTDYCVVDHLVKLEGLFWAFTLDGRGFVGFVLGVLLLQFSQDRPYVKSVLDHQHRTGKDHHRGEQHKGNSELSVF